MQSSREKAIEDLKATKKKIVKKYIIIVLVAIGFAVSSVFFTRWLMIPFGIVTVWFFREAFQLDNVNRDLDTLKRNR